MDTATIVAELESERDRLNSAIAALQGGSRRSYVRTAAGKPDDRKRRLSAAARKKIGEAMKKRWAERKKRAAA
jgi:exonuclease VII small subunit